MRRVISEKMEPEAAISLRSFAPLSSLLPPSLVQVAKEFELDMDKLIKVSLLSDAHAAR